MNEQIIKSDGIEICTDSFGKRVNPAVLLIRGAQSSLVWWDEEFCQRLAATGRFVVRYDNRVVGRSTTYEPGNRTILSKTWQMMLFECWMLIRLSKRIS